MKKWLLSILFCLLVFILNLAIGRFLEKPLEVVIKKGAYDPYTRWNDFYAQPPHSLDLIFLGSSHAYHSFDPAIFDAGLGTHSFNLGSSIQSPSTSYFVFKEALTVQKPKMVIWEMFWPTFMKGDQFYNASYNYDFIRDPGIKKEFYRDGFDWQGKLILLFPSYHYNKNLYDSIRLTLGKDILPQQWGQYKTKGYVEVTDIANPHDLANNNVFENFVFRKENILSKQILYIKKLVQLCRSQNISILLITAPLPPMSIEKIRNYTQIHDFVKDLAAGLNVPYLDSNTDAPKNLLEVEDFSDDSHLNKTGVKKFDDYVITYLKSGKMLNKP